MCKPVCIFASFEYLRAEIANWSERTDNERTDMGSFLSCFATKNAESVKDVLENVETLEGKFSHTGFWKIKQKLSPIISDPAMAKHDQHGYVITASYVQ